jgi:hypothetical protein
MQYYYYFPTIRSITCSVPQIIVGSDTFNLNYATNAWEKKNNLFIYSSLQFFTSWSKL